MSKVWLYDTTLRDGAQREGMSLSVEDKLKIARHLDSLGIHYIEGGWPGSNPKDIEFFGRLKEEPLAGAKLVAFGSTRRKGIRAADDAGLRQLLEAETPAIALVGKSWDLHVETVLRASNAENLEMISDSISYLKEQGREVIFDAEHFFDGYKNNPKYALETLVAAARAGADWLALCDTNGGSLPHEIAATVRAVAKGLADAGLGEARIGVHAHNDADCAVANSIAAVEAGATQVQGTVNGYGERCGNANLISIVPALQVKMGLDVLGGDKLSRLTEASHYVAEIANVATNSHQPYVGESAFAHKGGLHVDGVVKHSDTFEHMNPSAVGNVQRIVVSELSGKSTIELKARDAGIDRASDADWVRGVLTTVKGLEHRGYHFEAADASFELLLRKEAGLRQPAFELESFRVIMEQQGEGVQWLEAREGGIHRSSDGDMISFGHVLTEATVKIHVFGKRVVATAEGNGPVNALDQALRQAIGQAYPALKNIKLTDYKVRVLDEGHATGAVVRVLIESSDGEKTWGTIGVSENIIEASWEALVDSLEYGLLHKKKRRNGNGSDSAEQTGQS